MKYNKKTPYFQRGNKIQVAGTGKTREEILAEARGNQSIERRQQIADSQREGLNRVGAGFQRPRPTATINMPVDTRSAQIESTVGKPYPKTRGQAFQAARKRGDKEFTWNGKRYHTKTAEEMAAGTSLPSNTTTNAAGTNPTESAEQTTFDESTNDGWKSPDWDGTLISKEEVARRSRLRAFGTEGKPVEETVSVANVNTPAPTRTEDNSGNWLQRGFQRGLLRSIWDGIKYLDSHPKYGKIPSQSLGGNITRFQQGGQMPEEGSQEELVLDFAVRYLVTMGVPEEDIMDPQGNLNPEHQQELEQVFNSQEISWSDYAASPDEYMQQFIGNLQAQTQMARKGAKLKRLSQLRIYKK